MATVSFALVLTVDQPCAGSVVELFEHAERTGSLKSVCEKEESQRREETSRRKSKASYNTRKINK